MVRIKSGADKGAREEARLRVEQAGLDFDTAKELAKRKAK